MRRKALWGLQILMICVVTTGCWDRVEIEHRAFIVAIGLDLAEREDELRLTVQILKPGALAQGAAAGDVLQKGVWVASSTGHTVEEATRALLMQVGREPNFSHSIVLVIGEELAREGVLPLLDFFERHPQIQRRTWVIIANGSSAEEILSAESELDPALSVQIDRLIRVRRLTSTAAAVNLNDFIRFMTTPGKDATASRIELVGASDPEAVAREELERANQPASLGGMLAGRTNPKRVRVTGAAVFQRDMFVAFLDDRETRGLLWLVGDVGSGVLVTQCPGESRGQVTLIIRQTSVKLNPRLTEDGAKVDVSIAVASDIGDQQCGRSVINREFLDYLVVQQAAIVENEIRAALSKLQPLEVDAAGLGASFREKYPQGWRSIESEWRRIYAEIDVAVHVDSTILEPREVLRPPTLR